MVSVEAVCEVIVGQIRSEMELEAGQQQDDINTIPG